MADGKQITPLEGFRVVAIRGEGVAIVDGAGHYWTVYPDRLCERRTEDRLAAAYRKAVA